VLRGLTTNDGPIFYRTVLHVVKFGALLCRCLHGGILLSLVMLDIANDEPGWRSKQANPAAGVFWIFDSGV
jgi:hypothetical protein